MSGVGNRRSTSSREGFREGCMEGMVGDRMILYKATKQDVNCVLMSLSEAVHGVRI